jgi:hypothetical protein
MQPYLFPYLGYFQLMNAVDKFVAYDDVSYIRQGWINRNNILVNTEKFLVTVPVASRSSFVPINKTLVSDSPSRWQNKLLSTIRQAYARAPYFEHAFPLVESTLATAAARPISEVAMMRSARHYLPGCAGSEIVAGELTGAGASWTSASGVYQYGRWPRSDEAAFASRGVALGS